VTGRVERPIFVVGTGRCGLSLVVDLLGTHEDMAWFSQWTARFPRSNLAPKIPYLYYKPVIRQIIDLASLVARKQWRPGPRETYAPFTISFRGFANPYRPLTALDVDRNAHDGVYNALLKHVEGQRKQRFIAELSGWARIAFLRQIFPDAQFIHVVRDPRATVERMTADLQAALAAQIVHVEDTDLEPLVVEIENVYGDELFSKPGMTLPEGSRFAQESVIEGEIAKAVAALHEDDPESLVHLRRDLLAYRLRPLQHHHRAAPLGVLARPCADRNRVSVRCRAQRTVQPGFAPHKATIVPA
jgi:hypothetical protein